ncbi:hypothetical protein cgR_5005 [Corynebacterium glutamicum R]|uniref:Uncharacterized protein n=1 Tax=Corynebacterium glutamicum (strain R) TaxID=340322 RepID=A0AB72V8F2_CORGB|nr:hypothetical protein cgR_5005 [Corynebacterium glutamicum R]
MAHGCAHSLTFRYPSRAYPPRKLYHGYDTQWRYPLSVWRLCAHEPGRFLFVS